jgi:hypothetical protein
MAGLETLTGITKVNAFEYEVTAEVSVGSGIDDLEYATFVQKSGGLLKFDTGCTTTFTNCKFLEETSAASEPQNKRFIANSSTAPVFRGCKFIIDHGASGNNRGLSDFDVSTGTNPTFDFSEDGSPCYFIRNNGGTSEARANHYYSGTFNSFIVDQNGNGGAFEIMRPSLTINDLTLKDRGYPNPLSSRHLIVYTSVNLFRNKTTIFRKLKADNVSLFAGGTQLTDYNIIIQVIDAKGRLLRAEDTANSQRGNLQFLRTYQSAPLDATTLSATEVKCYLINTDNNDIIIDGITSGVDEELLQYKYEHNATATTGVITYDVNGDPQTTGTFFTVANNYIRGFISYDRLPTSRTFQIEDRNDGSPLVHDVVLADDALITADRATADGYSEINTPQAFYNRAKAYLVDNYAGETTTIVSREGTTINAGAYNVTIDASAAEVFAFDGTTITIKSAQFVGNITGSGTFTLLNGAEVVGTFGATTVYPWEVSNVEAGSTLQLFNVTQDIEIENLVVSGTAGTKVNASGTYATAEAVPSDTIRLRITCQAGANALLPFETVGVATASGASFRADQQPDSIYNANNIDGSSISGITLTPDYTNIQIDLDDQEAPYELSAQAIYNYYSYLITTPQGIANFYGAITPVDQMNYRINASVVPLKIQNTGSTDVVLNGGRLYRDDSVSVLDTGAGSGTGSIMQDTGFLVQYIQPQVGTALNNYGAATSTELSNTEATLKKKITQAALI